MQNRRTIFYPFTDDDKFSVFNRGNLLQHFQIQIYNKREIFSHFFFFFALSKFRLKSKNFEKKDDPHS